MKRLCSLLIALLAILVPVYAGAAEAPRLMVPAACTLGQDCWIVNHVDMNPAVEIAEDYTCGTRSYDGHEGTDFGLPDMAAMARGVSVLAAAGGTVLRVRDGMDDRQPSPEEIDAMLHENKGCGNGILVDHGQGWQTIYCHLKKGSISVQPQQKVTPGQKIAEIGQSGAAEFPHLHFGLFHQNRTVDPFSGAFAEDGCGVSQGALWMDGLRLDYEPMAVFAHGFAGGVPDFNALREKIESPDTLPPQLPALTFWAGMYGLRVGDIIQMDIIAPDGAVFATRSITQDTDRARQFYYVGKRASEPLAQGSWRGVVTVKRPIRTTSSETLSRSAERV
jgi:murein DD-endopeptidase MepM/ murein hydrolase activator NlpD